MWKSIGDKHEIIRHDENRRPRKIKSNGAVIWMAIILFVAGSIIFMNIRPQSAFYYYIPPILGILAVLTSITLMILKWKRNNKEVDLYLILALLVFAGYTYLTFTFFD